MSLAVATSITFTNTNDAAFRAWGSAIGVKLAAMGLVQTGDTGQINWTTVLVPASAQLVQGYEVWRFNDALQATAPVFIKLEYGSGPSAASWPSFWFSIGAGSNGSGSLTGVLSARQQQYASSPSGPITAFWCGDTDRVAFCFQGASAAATVLFSMERTVDAAGARTTEGILLGCYGPSAMQRVWNCATGPYTAWETSFGAMGGQQSPVGSTGAQVAIYPLFYNKGVFLPYGYNLFGYVDATIGANVAFSFPVYGVSHQYMPLGTNAISSVLARTSGPTAMMMRFD